MNREMDKDHRLGFHDDNVSPGRNPACQLCADAIIGVAPPARTTLSETALDALEDAIDRAILVREAARELLDALGPSKGGRRTRVQEKIEQLEMLL